MNQDSWNSYLYQIIFETGHWYGGVSVKKGDNPNDDGYFGSPITHKKYWSDVPYRKEVVALLFLDNPTSEMYEHEKNYLQNRNWKNDSLCLNEHCGGGFGYVACSNGGKKGGKIQVDLKLGIHKFSNIERSEIAKNNWKNKSLDDKIKIVDRLRTSYELLSDEQKTKIKNNARIREKQKWNSLSESEKNLRMCLLRTSFQNNRPELWEVISPDSVCFIVKNLSKFCRENELLVPLMNKVSKGLRKSHKGYKCRKLTKYEYA
jgi:hypothetical protein